MKILEKIQPLFLLYVFIFIIFIPILFLKKLFPGFDLLLVFYPNSFNYFNQQNFWFTGVFSGINALGSINFAGNWIYYFLSNKIGVNFFDFITFYNLIILFYFLLMAFFSYLASRLLGFDKYVSVIVTSVYIFSAYNLSWMVNIVTAPSLFIFPAIIYFLLKFQNTKNWLWPIFGGIAVGLSLIMSHPQFALIAIFGGFLFSLFLTFENGIKFPKWKFLAAFLLICLVGLALSAFQLVPEYQANRLAQRGVALGFGESQECALGIFDFIKYLIPNFNFGVNCESLLYVGILPLILAVLAIVYMRRDRRILFWLLLLVFALFFSIKYSPLAWIFHQLPVWGSLRGPARFMMLGNFSLAVLAGYGFNWILENKEKFKELKIFWWLKKIFFGFLILIIGINILGLFKTIFIKLAITYFDKYYYQKTIGLPVEYYHRSIENLISGNFYAFSFLNKDFLIPFILTILAFLVIIYIRKFNKNALFYAVILSGFAWAVTSPMVSSGLNRDFFNKTPIVEFLKTQPRLSAEGRWRVYSLLPGLATYQLVALAIQGASEADQNEFYKTMLPPNLNLIYGLDSVDGYDVSMPRRTARVLAELLSERATLGNKVAEARLKPEEKIKIFESRANLLSMMNVKYVISAYPLNENIFKKVFSAQGGSASGGETKTTSFNIPIYIYENKNILPRFYFAKAVKNIESDEITALEKILAPDTDFKAETFIECGDKCGNNSSGKIIDFEYKDGYLRLNTESSAGGWLVFSESFDKNWQAKINNKTIPIYRANYIYQAIKVPVGKNIIEFIYKP